MRAAFHHAHGWRKTIFHVCVLLSLIFAGCNKSQHPAGASTDPQTDAKTREPVEADSVALPRQTPKEYGANMKIRPPALAGQWYAAQPDRLRASIQKYLDDADVRQLTQPVRAIVVPHAGHAWSGPTAAAGFKVLDTQRIQRIFILSPNHRMPVYGVVSAGVDAFETPLGILEVDKQIIDKWRDNHIVTENVAAHKNEHAIEIQLPFIQVVFGDKLPKIVPLIVGEMSPEMVRTFATAMRRELREEDLVLISSDFLHYGANYGYVPFGEPVFENIKKFDARTVDAIRQINSAVFEQFARETPNCACGVNSLRVLAALFQADKSQLTFDELAYDTSGRKTNDTSMSVSYEALALSGSPKFENTTPASDAVNKGNTMVLNKDAQHIARDIVKQALVEAVSHQHETSMPEGLLKNNETTAVFRESYGVFVTLNDADGDLRGCIGNIIPVAPLGEGIWGRAQDAALNDPRFNPVQIDELSSLSFEISVLTKPVRISGPDQIVIGRHGVVMHKDGRSAVFLPQVAPEQGWDVETMLIHLSMKAGLRPDAWREGARFEVFEAQVF